MSGHGNEMVARKHRAMIRFAPANSGNKDTINRDKRADTGTDRGQPIDCSDIQAQRRGLKPHAPGPAETQAIAANNRKRIGHFLIRSCSSHRQHGNSARRELHRGAHHWD